MEPVIPPSSGLFASVGGALFRRAFALLGDERAAVDAAEGLFVRFVVHARGQTMDERARWRWIYRVATSHCLRLMPDDGPPGGASRAVPVGRLRAFDEATQNIAALAAWDGLTPDEVAEVLELPVKLVRRRLAASVPDVLSAADDKSAAGDKAGAADRSGADRHPSGFALQAGRAAHAEHVAGCALCRSAIEQADGVAARFARELAPEASGRVVAAIRAERLRIASGPRWKRALWMTGAAVAVVSLALFVARPRRPDRIEAPYGGPKGASRQKASGLLITVRRAEEVRPLKPDAALRAGDRLHFRVRSERPRYLELRVRRAAAGRAATEVRVFPGQGGESSLVLPGQPLDRDYVLEGLGPNTGGGRAGAGAAGGVGAPVGKLSIFALFADHPFPLDQPPGPDVEVVPVRVDIEP